MWSTTPHCKCRRKNLKQRQNPTVNAAARTHNSGLCPPLFSDWKNRHNIFPPKKKNRVYSSSCYDCHSNSGDQTKRHKGSYFKKKKKLIVAVLWPPMYIKKNLLFPENLYQISNINHEQPQYIHYQPKDDWNKYYNLNKITNHHI